VPKRLRYYLQRDKGALNAALRIFLRVVQQSLQTHCPGAAKADPASLHLGAVAFIHRFGSSLNTHVHFHVCVVDGVFEAVAGPIAQNVDTDAGAQANPQPGPAPAPTPQSVIFHAATGLDESAIATVQANVRKRILRAFVARGHIEAGDAKDMAAYAHGGGFSVDAGVLIEATDRAGLERLLRYCARPPFAMDIHTSLPHSPILIYLKGSRNVPATIAAPSQSMRSTRHKGTRPQWNGRSEYPARFIDVPRDYDLSDGSIRL